MAKCFQKNFKKKKSRFSHLRRIYAAEIILLTFIETRTYSHYVSNQNYTLGLFKYVFNSVVLSKLEKGCLIKTRSTRLKEQIIKAS